MLLRLMPSMVHCETTGLQCSSVSVKSGSGESVEVSIYSVGNFGVKAHI